MIPPDYLVLRLARHYLPDRLSRSVLRTGTVLQPGLETRDPAAAAARYAEALERHGRQLSGAGVLVLGYGGYFGVAVALLELGARHVTLCDPYAKLHHRANARLANQAPEYLRLQDGRVQVDPAVITVLPVDIVQAARQAVQLDVDLVVSWSVYEHLADPGAVTAALAQITTPAGCNLHFIDLRDHYFRHPFEMLCYRERTWRALLNPSSNLNRWRIWQYQEVFQDSFGDVQIEVVERDLRRFLRARARIHPRFLSGDEGVDSATRVMVYAAQPKLRM